MVRYETQDCFCLFVLDEEAECRWRLDGAKTEVETALQVFLFLYSVYIFLHSSGGSVQVSLWSVIGQNVLLTSNCITTLLTSLMFKSDLYLMNIFCKYELEL